MKVKIILAALALLLTSCNLYRKYSPVTEVPQNLYRDQVNNSDSTSLADLGWKELFTDTLLQRLIETGLRQNTDLRVAQLKTEEAEASLRAARLAYLPALSIDPQGGVSSVGGSPAAWSYNIPINASWELDIFGRLTASKRQAYAAFLESNEYRQAVQTRLIAQIANLYYTLLMLDRQYAITHETSFYWRESLRVTQSLMSAGMATEAAVAQTQAACYAVELTVKDMEQSIRETENTLSVLLGNVPGRIERSLLEAQDLPLELSTGIAVHLLSRRPDVKQAELRLAQAFYGTTAARANFYPSLRLTGTGGWANSVGNFIANPASLFFSAAASLTQPIFNRGINRAKLKIAKAQQEEASLQFQQTLLNAGKEVNDALSQAQTARSKVSTRKQQVQSLESAVRSTELLMNHGSTTYLEVLTARQSLLNAQLSQVNDRFDELQATVNLYQALGGGQ